MPSSVMRWGEVGGCGDASMAVVVVVVVVVDGGGLPNHW